MTLSSDQNKPSRYAILLLHGGSPTDTSWIETWRFLRRKLSDKRLIDPIPRWLWYPFLHLFLLPWRISKVQDAQKSIWVSETCYLSADTCDNGESSLGSHFHTDMRKSRRERAVCGASHSLGRGSSSSCSSSSRKRSDSPPPVPSTPPLGSGKVTAEPCFTSVAPFTLPHTDSSVEGSLPLSSSRLFSSPASVHLPRSPTSLPTDEKEVLPGANSSREEGVVENEEENVNGSVRRSSSKKKRAEEEGEASLRGCSSVSTDFTRRPFNPPMLRPCHADGSSSFGRRNHHCPGGSHGPASRADAVTARSISSCTSIQLANLPNGCSPSVYYTTRLCGLLQEYFRHPNWVAKNPEKAVQVECGFAYQSGSIEKALQRFQLRGDYTNAVDSEGHRAKVKDEHLLLLPLFPQYSSVLTASLFDTVMQSSFFKSSIRKVPSIHFRSSYFTHPRYIHCLKRHIRKYFSLHGRPSWLFIVFPTSLKSFVVQNENDVYLRECYRTFANLRQHLAQPSRPPPAITPDPSCHSHSFPFSSALPRSSSVLYPHAGEGRSSPPASILSSTSSNMFFPHTSSRDATLQQLNSNPPPGNDGGDGGGPPLSASSSSITSSKLHGPGMAHGRSPNIPVGDSPRLSTTDSNGMPQPQKDDLYPMKETTTTTPMRRSIEPNLASLTTLNDVMVRSSTAHDATPDSILGTHVSGAVSSVSHFQQQHCGNSNTATLSSTFVSASSTRMSPRQAVPPLHFPSSSPLPSPCPPSVPSSRSQIEGCTGMGFSPASSMAPCLSSMGSAARETTPTHIGPGGTQVAVPCGRRSGGGHTMSRLMPQHELLFPSNRIKLIFLPNSSTSTNSLGRSFRAPEKGNANEVEGRDTSEEPSLSLATLASGLFRSPSVGPAPPISSSLLPLHLRYHPEKVFADAYAEEKQGQGLRMMVEETAGHSSLLSPRRAASHDWPPASVHTTSTSFSTPHSTTSTTATATSISSSAQHSSRAYIFCPGNVVEDESTMLSVRNHLVPQCEQFWNTVRYIPALNDSDGHVHLLAGLLEEYMPS